MNKHPYPKRSKHSNNDQTLCKYQRLAESCICVVGHCHLRCQIGHKTFCGGNIFKKFNFELQCSFIRAESG